MDKQLPHTTEADLRCPSSREWFAVYTWSCQEKRVARHLSANDVEFFLPLYRRISRWKNGLRVPIESPLFPGYIFVKIERKERFRVLELPGTHSIVGTPREPTPLPGGEIEMLRDRIHLLGVEPHSYMNVGDRVNVRSGPLNGMSGIVVRRRNGCRLVVSLDLIMKSVAVEVDEGHLETAAPSPLPLLSAASEAA
jgi:transcription antitermination factor NusG